MPLVLPPVGRRVNAAQSAIGVCRPDDEERPDEGVDIGERLHHAGWRSSSHRPVVVREAGADHREGRGYHRREIR